MDAIMNQIVCGCQVIFLSFNECISGSAVEQQCLALTIGLNDDAVGVDLHTMNVKPALRRDDFTKVARAKGMIVDDHKLSSAEILIPFMTKALNSGDLALAAMLAA